MGSRVNRFLSHNLYLLGLLNLSPHHTTYQCRGPTWPDSRVCVSVTFLYLTSHVIGVTGSYVNSTAPETSLKCRPSVWSSVVAEVKVSTTSVSRLRLRRGRTWVFCVRGTIFKSIFGSSRRSFQWKKPDDFRVSGRMLEKRRYSKDIKSSLFC